MRWCRGPFTQPLWKTPQVWRRASLHLHSFVRPWCAGFHCCGPHATILKWWVTHCWTAVTWQSACQPCVRFANLTFYCKNNRPMSLQPAVPMPVAAVPGEGGPPPMEEGGWAGAVAEQMGWQGQREDEGGKMTTSISTGRAEQPTRWPISKLQLAQARGGKLPDSWKGLAGTGHRQWVLGKADPGQHCGGGGSPVSPLLPGVPYSW